MKFEFCSQLWFGRAKNNNISHFLSRSHIIERIDQTEFEGFEYVNPLLMSLEDCVWHQPSCQLHSCNMQVNMRAQLVFPPFTNWTMTLDNDKPDKFDCFLFICIRFLYCNHLSWSWKTFKQISMYKFERETCKFSQNFTWRFFSVHSKVTIPFNHTVYMNTKLIRINSNLFSLFFFFHLVCRCLFVNRMCVYVCSTLCLCITQSTVPYSNHKRVNDQRRKVFWFSRISFLYINMCSFSSIKSSSFRVLMFQYFPLYSSGTLLPHFNNKPKQ